MQAISACSGVNSSRDMAFTPSHGWDYSVAVEKDFGGFDYAQASANLRYYIPERNVLGIKPDSIESRSLPNDVSRRFPTASIALQAQAILADGDVPYKPRGVGGYSRRTARADL